MHLEHYKGCVWQLKISYIFSNIKLENWLIKLGWPGKIENKMLLVGNGMAFEHQRVPEFWHILLSCDFLEWNAYSRQPLAGVTGCHDKTK